VETRLVLGELADSGPGAFGGGTHYAEDFLELVFICSAWEEGAPGVHFCHYASGRPDVDAGVVGAGAEENVGGTVPQCDHFVREGIDRNAKRSR